MSDPWAAATDLGTARRADVDGSLADGDILDPGQPPVADDGDDSRYAITPESHHTVGDVAVRTTTATEGVVAGPAVRQLFETSAAEPDGPAPLWLGYDATAHRGFREAPLRFDALFRHLWVTGTTGYGKSTLLLNLLVQLACRGHGFVFIDPKVRDARQLLRMLPPDRLDDVIWLAPGETTRDRTVGLNFLDLPDCVSAATRANAIEARVETLKAVLDTDEYWGVNMESITESMARAMLQSDTQFSVLDLYFTLLDSDRRAAFAADVDDPYVRAFCEEIAAMDAETIRPLLKRIKTWVENAVIRRIIAHRDRTLDFREVVATDRIVIVSTPVESTAITRLVALGVMRQLWSAIQQRFHETTGPQAPYFVVCDEFDDVASPNLDIEAMLAKARAMRLSVTLSTQYPSQLDETTQTALSNNCDTLLAFSVNDIDDARVLMKRFQGYSAADLIATDQYRAWTRLPLGGGEYSEPVLIETFPPYPPRRDSEAAEAVIDASLDRFGAPPPSDRAILENLVYGDLAAAAPAERELAELMAAAVRAVQLRTGCRAQNGWVDVRAVDEAVARRHSLLGQERAMPAYDPSDLPEVREASPLVETDVDLESDAVVTRLTDDGIEAAQPTTGDVQAAGGEGHDALLAAADRQLTSHGFTVAVLEQDGGAAPDALASHPAFERTFTVEAEATTPNRPAKVLQNLARARGRGRTPLFVVRGDESDERADESDPDADDETDAMAMARRIEGICSPPVCERATAPDRYYTRDERVTFGGGATSHGGVTAVRPRTDAGRRTVWIKEGDERVLSDGDTEFARVPATGDLSKDDVPAYYSYDQATERYTVHTPGETQQYHSQAAFEADWVPIKRPFCPENDLPSGTVARDDYAILVCSADGPPQVYRAGETVPLPACLEAGTLWPGETDAEPATDGNAATVAAPDGEEEHAIAAFASLYLTEAPDATVPKPVVFDAYRAWLTDADIDGTTDPGWFTRKLRTTLDVELDRTRVDGDRVRQYVGVRLTAAGEALLDGGDAE